MTEVLEPQFTYARDPYSKRVITLCYRVASHIDKFMAIAGLAMNRPNEQFSKKIGRRISHGRMESVNSLVCIPLNSLRKTERREEILQFIAGNTHDHAWSGFVDPLMARVMREYLWYRDIEAVIEKGLDSLMGVDSPEPTKCQECEGRGWTAFNGPMIPCTLGCRYLPTDPHETSLREIPPPQEDYIEPVPC